ncbi:hypothetical protein F8M41_018341 [Gigaspora margarita]|uniref:Uncharacterized protein n=1 Tax=Gigaspora margarita TaxID=4874 RepID=A0A8H4ALV2_GIGMA|nr:hypothetical protein F8M41_018341 [Gigaspora margarita]
MLKLKRIKWDERHKQKKKTTQASNSYSFKIIMQTTAWIQIPERSDRMKQDRPLNKSDEKNEVNKNVIIENSSDKFQSRRKDHTTKTRFDGNRKAYKTDEINKYLLFIT